MIVNCDNQGSNEQSEGAVNAKSLRSKAFREVGVDGFEPPTLCL